MLRSRAALAVTLSLLAVGLAGCSAASDDAPATKSDSQIAAEAKAWDVENASCMRAAGIDVGDPSNGGGMKVSMGDVDMDTVSAAAEKCQKSTTKKLGERPVTAAEKKSDDEYEKKTLKADTCLRDKGYDVPDPTDEAAGGDGTTDIPQDVLDACGASQGGTTAVTP